MALANSNDIHEACQSLAKVGGWELQLETMQIRWTSETYRIHEVDPETHVPTVENGIQFYAPDAQPLIRRALERAISHAEPFELELEFLTAKGNRLWVLATGRPDLLEGRVVRLWGAIQDITKRKRLEEEVLRAQRMESIGNLAGGIAHDLNNILSPIVVSAELLSRSWDLDAVEVIRTNAQRGADMIGQILTFARGSASIPQPVSIQEAFQHLQRLMRETFPRDITLRVECESDLAPIMADPTHLHQILLNLCVNARDAMPDGGELQLTARATTLNRKPAVLLRVRDEGAGIPPDVQARLFEPFFTTKEVGHGTGLGLSTVRQLVQQYEGRLEYQTRQGLGTVFEVILPATTEALRPEPSVLQSDEEAIGCEVLVVDDELPICTILTKVLQKKGFEVSAAHSSREGLVLFEARQQQIGLVITDLMMPGGSAIGLLKQIRELRPEVPVLAISGMPDGTVKDALAELRIEHFLAKPFDVKTLMRAVHQALSQTPTGELA